VTTTQDRGFRRSVSFWLGVALSFVRVLQAIPVVGEIFLFAGGIFLPGLIAHALLAALLLEALTRRIPRVWVAVPMLAYGAYYITLFGDLWKIQAATQAIAASHLAEALRFDPLKQSLVITDARSFVAEYNIPVAYEADKKAVQDGYIAYRLLSHEQCETLRTTRAMPGLSRILPRYEDHPNDDSGCVFATPERPPFATMTATKLGLDKMWSEPRGIAETGVDITADGRTIARYRTGGYAWLQPTFPWFFWFGCARLPVASYRDSPNCGLEFIRTLTRFGRAEGSSSSLAHSSLCSRGPSGDP